MERTQRKIAYFSTLGRIFTGPLFSGFIRIFDTRYIPRLSHFPINKRPRQEAQLWITFDTRYSRIFPDFLVNFDALKYPQTNKSGY